MTDVKGLHLHFYKAYGQQISAAGTSRSDASRGGASLETSASR